MWSNGGDEKNIATPETAAALQLLVDLVKDGSASKSVVNWGQADVNDQFKAGNAAMMINGPWQFPVLNAEKSLNYGVAPTPAPKAGATVVSPLGGETWTVPQTGNKARQQKAAKIVECLNSDDNQLLQAKERQTVPTKTALQAKFVADQPAMAAFSELVADGPGAHGRARGRLAEGRHEDLHRRAGRADRPGAAARRRSSRRRMASASPAGALVAPAPGRRRSSRRRQRVLELLLLAPAVVYLLLFFGYPIVKNVWMGFQDYTSATFFTGVAPWVGLDNYRDVIGSNVFSKAAVNTRAVHRRLDRRAVRASGWRSRCSSSAGSR